MFIIFLTVRPLLRSQLIPTQIKNVVHFLFLLHAIYFSIMVYSKVTLKHVHFHKYDGIEISSFI